MKPLSERLDKAALVLSDTAQIKSQFPEWLRNEIEAASGLMNEAAELARRVEGAPSVEITACNQIEGARDFDYGDLVAAVQKFDAGLRVRIVPEAGLGEG